MLQFALVKTNSLQVFASKFPNIFGAVFKLTPVSVSVSLAPEFFREREYSVNSNNTRVQCYNDEVTAW